MDIRSTFSKYLFIFFFISIAFFIFFSANKPKPPVKPLEKIIIITKATEKPRLKTILYWNKYYFTPDFEFGFGHEPFVKKCEINNCYVTDNRSYQNIDEFDAVLFHGPLYYVMNKTDNVPPIRSPKQYYAILSHECPAKFSCVMYYNPHLINITMNYRLDSDIFLPYYRFYNTKNEYVGPQYVPKWIQPIHDPTYLNKFRNIFDRKTKPVAWIVSNCYDYFNRRNEHVDELKKYISVDVYGKCGNLTCEKEGNSSCYNLVKNDYYFYLAYENANCVDYVTEKLFTAMKNDAIPVILNGADMTRMAPPYTYINARDYTPEKLAEYLKYLIAHPEEYLKYHWWRNTYNISVLVPADPLCKLCEFLNAPHIGSSSYEDYCEWYAGSSGNRICTLEPRGPLPTTKKTL